MSNEVATIVTVVACLVVAVILFMGLWNMFRGGDPNRSQMLIQIAQKTLCTGNKIRYMPANPIIAPLAPSIGPDASLPRLSR